MNNPAGLSKKYENHFMLDEAKLRKITDILKTHADKKSETPLITYYATTRSDAFFATSDLNHLLSYDNPKEREVITLRIELKVEKSGMAVNILFSIEGSDKIQLSIIGPDRDWCFVLADELDTQVKRTHTSKIWSTLESGAADYLFLLFIAIVGAAAAVFYVFTSENPDPSAVIGKSTDEKLDWILQEHIKRLPSKTSGLPWAIPLSTFLLTLTIQNRPIHDLIRWLRRSVFYWGDAKDRHDEYLKLISNIKWGVVGSIVFGVISGLIVMIIQLRFFS